MHRRSWIAAVGLTLSLTGCGDIDKANNLGDFLFGVPREPPLPETWLVAPTPTHEPRPLPSASHDAQDEEGSLLASYAARPTTALDKRAEWSLPTNAKTLIVETLIAAAKDDPELLERNLTVAARVGLPDRGELRGRPIYTDDDPLGIEFLTDFREVTSRLKKRATFNCRPLQPGWEMLVASGAEPMWCTYTSDDGFDLLVFRLVVDGSAPAIDYVGFMRERPTDWVRVANIGDRPPTTPYMKTKDSLPGSEPPAGEPVVVPRRPEPPPEIDEPRPAPEPSEPKPKADSAGSDAPDTD